MPCSVQERITGPAGNHGEREPSSRLNNGEEIRNRRFAIRRFRSPAGIIFAVMAVDQINGQTRCRLRNGVQKRDLARLVTVITTMRLEEIVKTRIPRRIAEDFRNVLGSIKFRRSFRRLMPDAPGGMPRTALHRATRDIRRIEMAMQAEPCVFQYAARLIDDEAPAKPRDKPHAPFGKWLRDAALILGDNVLDLLPFRLFPRVILAKSHELFKAQ